MQSRQLAALVGAILGLCVLVAAIFALDRGELAPEQVASVDGPVHDPPLEGPSAEIAAPPLPEATREVDPERSAVAAAPRDDLLEVEIRGLAQGARAEVALVDWQGRSKTPLSSVVDLVVDQRIVDEPDPVARFEWPMVSGQLVASATAPGYAPTQALVEQRGQRVVLQLQRSSTVRVSFPDLGAPAGRMVLVTTPGRERLFEEPTRIPLDASGTVELHDVAPNAGFGFTLLSIPERSSDLQPLAVLGGQLRVTPDKREFVFPGLVARRVQILPPIPGETFELKFQLVPPSAVALPSQPGWSGAYGLYGLSEIASDATGSLVLHLLEGTSSKSLLTGAVSGTLGLSPFTVERDGPLQLERRDP